MVCERGDARKELCCLSCQPERGKKGGGAFLNLRSLVPQIAQCQKLCTNTRYLTREVVEYAEMLKRVVADPQLDTVVFVSSGSEANDVAWRIATTVTGRRGGLCTQCAYHGITEATAALTPSSHRQAPIASHIRRFAPPNLEPDVDKALDEALKGGFEPAAVIVDPLFMSDGVLEAPPGYLPRLQERIHACGGLYIADEVQAGYGRTGTSFFGFQHFGLKPDLVTIGKPAGNGHPIGAVICKRAHLDEFHKHYGFVATFGGNNVSAAIGIAVIEVIERDHLIENAGRMGKLLRAELETLQTEFPKLIVDVRGVGMGLGLELPDEKTCLLFLRLLSQAGVLAGSDGPKNNVVKIRPPLIFTQDNIDEALRGFRKAMRDLEMELERGEQ